MPKILRVLIFFAVTVALAADVVVIAWATKLNFLIVVPVVLSAAYLAYMAAHWAILRNQKS